LGLRDPTDNPAARIELAESMRDPAHSLRRLPFALQFAVKLDLDAVETEIDRQEALSGGTSPDAAIARLAMALAKETPAKAVHYIERHRAQLLGVLNCGYVVCIEIEMLVKAGRLDAAERRVLEPNSGITEPERQRLTGLIAEARGINPVDEREKRFKSTDALIDLSNLVDLLVERHDVPLILVYAKLLFERTHNVPSCRAYAGALYETGDYSIAADFLEAHKDLVSQSMYLESLFAWSLFKAGHITECRGVLASLTAKRYEADDRNLTVNLAIASGDWAH
jgi:hypothetical protein